MANCDLSRCGLYERALGEVPRSGVLVLPGRIA